MGEPGRGDYLFVSYASGDRERVAPVVAALEQAGIAVWLDQTGIAGGANYGPEIVAAIREARAVLVLCSAAGFASRNVRQEIALAWKHERPIVPLRLERVEPPPELEYWLEGAQWIDALDRPPTAWLTDIRHGLERVGFPVLALDSHGQAERTAEEHQRPTAETRSNLPISLTSFVGRERELGEIVPLVASSRLLTLTGAGGSGKTRLALEVARRVTDSFPDGVWLVELAPLADPGLLLQTVASVLEIREGAGRSLLEGVVGFLAPRQLLVLVDNTEHLIAACAGTSEALLVRCPGLRILTTGREPLGVPGEVVYRVPPLAMPDAGAASTDEIGNSEAVGLFVTRAAASKPGFALSNDNADAVARLCRRLDGIPFALELAASRVGLLGVDGLLARLDDRFRLLSGGSRTALPRHQTLRGLIDWSYELLSEPERALLARVGVFAGGWTLDAAEAVAAGEEIDRRDVLDLLDHLVAKSLVTLDHGPQARFGMLESVREYARERLLERGEAAAARAAHARHFTALAKRSETALAPRPWLDALETDLANVRLMLDWQLSDGDPATCLRLAWDLWALWYLRGYLREGIAWIEQALARGTDESAPQRAEATIGLAFLVWATGDGDRATSLAAEAVDLARPSGDAHALAVATYTHGLFLGQIHFQLDRSIALLNEAIPLARLLGTDRGAWLFPYAVGDLGGVMAMAGRRETAIPMIEEAIVMHDRLGDDYGTGVSTLLLASLALVNIIHAADWSTPSAIAQSLNRVLALGETIEPASLAKIAAGYRRGLELHTGVGDATTNYVPFVATSVLAALSRQLYRAAILIGAGATMRERSGAVMQRTVAPIAEVTEQFVRERLGNDAFEAAIRAGRALTIEEASAEALAIASELEHAARASQESLDEGR
jgi:non-specific serine/threonine protein kinase